MVVKHYHIEEETFEETVTIFKTGDGMAFRSKSEAERRLQALKNMQIKKNLVSIKIEHPFESTVSQKWTMIRNEKELGYFVSKSGNPYSINNRYYLNDRGEGAKADLSVGDWVAECVLEDRNDAGGFWTLSFLYSKMQELVEEIGERTVEGKF